MKVCIDPDMGGATIVAGGHPPSILAAGYIGSTIFGGLFIMAGFDTLVSKIMSFVLGIGLVAPLAVVRNKLCVFSFPVCCRSSEGASHPPNSHCHRRFRRTAQQNDPSHCCIRGPTHWILVH